MVDRQARDKLAELLRQFADGFITIGQFVEEAPKGSEDPAIIGILELCQGLHGDLYRRESFRRMHQNVSNAGDDHCLECRFEGEHALRPRQLRLIERTILFLHSDLEYEWDDTRETSTNLNWWQALLVLPAILIGVFLWIAIAASTSPRVAIACVVGLSVAVFFAIAYFKGSYWPFKCRSDYMSALGSPVLLSGRRDEP